MQTVPVVENSLIERLTDVLSEVEVTGQSLTKMLSTLHVINSETSNSELDVQFAAMFAEVTNEFLRGDHGLNAYLSTRVRHGKLSNALRKPVADEFLVTERKVGTSDYVPNDYWDSALTALTNEERANVLHVLEKFAASIDSIIAYVRDSLIQVVVVHELVTSGDNPHALSLTKLRIWSGCLFKLTIDVLNTSMTSLIFASRRCGKKPMLIWLRFNWF